MSPAAKTDAEPVIDELVSERVQHESLAEALAAFQMEIPTIAKSKTATVKSEKGSYDYDYADLSLITAQALPVLARHGLSFSARPTMTKAGFVLKYSLAHESGDFLKGKYPLPGAGSPAQQLGSAITYARRYALCAVTGLAPGGDDDDAAIAPAAKSTRSRKAPRGEQAADVMIASKDWLAMVKPSSTLEDLRALYHQVEVAGELAAKIHPTDNMTVGQALWMRRNNVPAATAKRAPVAPREAPAESESEQPLSEAEQAELDARDSGAAEPTVATPLPLAEPEVDWNVAPIPGGQP